MKTGESKHNGLSLSERQRFALIAALLGQPPVVLSDSDDGLSGAKRRFVEARHHPSIRRTRVSTESDIGS